MKMEHMGDNLDHNQQQARQGRVVALVIAGTMILWLAGQRIGGAIGLQDRYVFLFDLLALAGFLWAMIVAFQMWRNRQDND